MVAGGAFFVDIPLLPCGIDQFTVEESPEIPVGGTADQDIFCLVHGEFVFDPDGTAVGELRVVAGEIQYHACGFERGGDLGNELIPAGRDDPA